jgi:hypothetical protein
MNDCPLLSVNVERNIPRIIHDINVIRHMLLSRYRRQPPSRTIPCSHATFPFLHRPSAAIADGIEQRRGGTQILVIVDGQILFALIARASRFRLQSPHDCTVMPFSRDLQCPMNE